MVFAMVRSYQQIGYPADLSRSFLPKFNLLSRLKASELARFQNMGNFDCESRDDL
jgi:hypothetical protein